MDCRDGQYSSKDGKRCCEQCSAGKYATTQCEGSHNAVCGECQSGVSYTSTENHLKRCLKCSACKAKNQRTEVQCTANKDTVCGCESDFYCTNDSCDSCQSVTGCPEGHGVISIATRTNDTVCAPCLQGTFSNVSDSSTACQRHTKCEAMGRVVETPGTHTRDTVCGSVIVQCSWMLPAGLWSGLVLTCLIILLAIICWRSKRRSLRADIPSVPVQPVPVAHVYPVELALPAATEWIGLCQDSCDVKSCEPPLYYSGETVVNPYVKLDVENGLVKTPLITPDLYVPSNDINGNDSNYTSNSLRIPSEPQEDEWGGTE